MLDGHAKEDLTGNKSKVGTLADYQTRATVSRLPKTQTALPLTVGTKDESVRSFRQKLASHAGSRSFSNNNLSSTASEINRKMMGTTGNVKRPQDIFHSKGSAWGVNDNV